MRVIKGVRRICKGDELRGERKDYLADGKQSFS